MNNDVCNAMCAKWVHRNAAMFVAQHARVAIVALFKQTNTEQRKCVPYFWWVVKHFAAEVVQN